MKTRHLNVLFHKEEDMYIAECPEVGTVDQGATKEEAVAGLKEATRLYLEELPRSYSLCVSLEHLIVIGVCDRMCESMCD